MDALDRAVAAYVDHLRVERGASHHTVAGYESDLERYVADLRGACGVAELRQVTPAMVAGHLERLRAGGDGRAGLAASSVARARAAIRGLHRFALREGLAADDAAGEVPAPKLGEHLPKALTVEQVDRLLAAARSGGGVLALRDSALLEMLYATGARISEAVGLAVDDLDLDAEYPVVRLFGKGRKERIVPVGHYAREAVAAYLVRSRPALAARGNGTAALFLGARGGRLSRQSAWTILQRTARRARLGVHVSPHTLRHSFATHLLAGGASVRDVQELLGHASVATTQIYTRVTPTALVEVYRSTHPRAREGASPAARG